MTPRTPFALPTALLLALILAAPTPAGAGEATERAKALGIPTLDEVAGEWTPMDRVVNPPSLHNGHNMLIADRDLTSYFFSPGGWLYNLANYADQTDPVLWRRGYPAVKLLVDGVEYQAKEARQGNYRVLRRNTDCNGLAVETDTRLVDEERGVLSRITLTNTTLLPRTFEAALSMPGSLQADGVGVSNTFQRAGVVSVVRPAQKPDKVDIDAYIVAIWKWRITLPPGGSRTLEFAAGDEPTKLADTDGFIQGDIGNQKGGRTDARVAGYVKRFDAAFQAAREARENRWADAFTPGNKHFSGNLPVLETDDAALKRNYYMGIYTFLCTERTNLALHPRSFITNGERDDGTQFYTDIAFAAPLWILLEPDGMKVTLRRWLTQNIRGGAWIDLRQTKGYDPRRLDRMYGYAYNACLFLKTADTYLRMTGDLAFLDEKLENGRTVFEQMDALATDWETLPKDAHGLVDYGGNECLLECAADYAHCVASMNAQVVWMMRRMADWHAFRGDPRRAKAMRQQATAFLPKVMGLYKPGDGVWYAYHMDGKRIESRHCIDYIFAGEALCDDLSPTQKTEMNSFVKRELFTRDWMRAMSLKDPAASTTKRTDHGANGSYDPWIPLTVGTMWRLGDPQAAYDLYRRTAVATREGSFTQAHEFYGPTWDQYDAPVRISNNKGCMREASGSGNFSSVVIETFFGFSPDLKPQGQVLADPATPRPFEGELRHVRFRDRMVDIKAGRNGLEIPPPQAGNHPDPKATPSGQSGK